MFSMMLMAALATANDLPNCLSLHRNHECQQCGAHRSDRRCGRHGCGAGVEYGGCDGSPYGDGVPGGYNRHGFWAGHDFYGTVHFDYYGSSSFAPWAFPTRPTVPMPPPGGGSLSGFSAQIDAACVGKARMILDVPEDARVYVNGTLTKTASNRRVYYSPRLEAGQSYFYEVRIEVEREGKTYTENKRVIVKAGDDHKESFADLGKRPSDTAVADAQP